MSTPQDTFNKLKWGSQVSKLKDKIKHEMDELQRLFESNAHIKDPSKASEQLAKCSLYTSHMSDEDYDYYHGCMWALENKHEWNLDAEVSDEEVQQLQAQFDHHNEPRLSTDGKFNLIWSEEQNKWVADPVQLAEYLNKKK